MGQKVMPLEGCYSNNYWQQERFSILGFNFQCSYGFMARPLQPLGAKMRSLGIIGLAEEEILRFNSFSHLESGYIENLWL